MAAGVVAYLPSFSGVFVFDDIQGIVDNPYIRRLWPITQAMTAPAQSSLAGRPVASLTLAVNYAIDGLNVRGYHAFNLAIHLLAGLLLYGIVRRTLLCERLRDRYGGDAHWLAAIIALLWVIHPLQTESVTYVIQRTESLAGLFYLLTVYCFIRGAAVSRPAFWYVAAVMSCALGMGTKEIVATAPLVVLLYDRIFLSERLGEAIRCRMPLYVGLAAAWGVLAAIVVGGPRSASAGFGLDYLPPRKYAATQPGIILHYLWLCFWPVRLCLDYQWPTAKTFMQIVPPAIVLAGLAGATIWALIRRPALGFVGASFFLLLAPTSSFVPIMDPAFEHRMYLPLAAVVAAVVLSCYELVGRRGMAAQSRGHATRLLIAGGLVVIVAGLLGYRTLERNKTYQSGVAMWSDVLATNPGNPRAHNNLANHLIHQGKPREAILHCQEALRLNHDYEDARNNLGIAYEKVANQMADQGKHEEAIRLFWEALRCKPDLAEAHNNLGISLRALGHVDEAIAEYREALRIDPHYANAMISLGNALRQQGHMDEAIEQYSAAVVAAPKDANAHLKLGAAYMEQDKLDDAIEEIRSALRSNPAFAHALFCLGQVQEKQSHLAEAVESYRAALAADPNHADARRALDAALAKQGGSSASAPAS